jgi:hypothetical protein
MKGSARFIAYRWYLALVLGSVGPSAWADVPLASRDADRQAKAAAPAKLEAFIYVYRGDDTDTTPIAVTLTGRETARLAPRTFGFWKVGLGRYELTVERSASTLPLQTEGGRVYYVELTRGGAGVPALRVVSFATGRTQVYRAQLVAQTKESTRVRAASAPSYPGATNGAITFKLGSLKVAEATQTIVSVPRVFDDSASSVLGVEGEWFLRPDISLGLELVRYSSKFTNVGGGAPGEIGTTAVLVNAKRYFLPDSSWQPFVGAGLGAAANSFSGSVTGNTGGLALQLIGGVQWRIGQFALRGEYKYLRAKTEDDSGQQVDVSGSGPFLSVGFYF